jgi:hypothetical protein
MGVTVASRCSDSSSSDSVFVAGMHVNARDLEERKIMNANKLIVAILGAGFLLVGIIGFVAPHLLGMHLGMTHNVVHLVSGALALYFAFAGTTSALRTFSFVFGIVYGLLGIFGFILGSGSDKMLSVIPGYFEVGRPDHLIHILLGVLFVIAGFSAVRAMTSPTPGHHPA